MNRLSLIEEGELPNGSSCPFHTTCAATKCPSNGPEFKEYYRNNPLPTPEQACLLAIITHEKKKKGKTEFSKKAMKADHLLDSALVISTHDKESAMDTFRQLANTLSEIDNLSPSDATDIATSGQYKHHSRMRVVDAFMSAYKDRIAGSPVSPDSAELAYAGLCSHLRDFDNLYARKGKPRKGEPGSLRVEYEILALFNRQHLDDTSYFGFMATAREEASNQSENNHDISIMKNDYSSKIPVQVKFHLDENVREYDEKILMIGYTDIIQAVQYEYDHAKEENDNMQGMGPEAPSIISLLTQEQRLGHIGLHNKITRRLLDAGSEFVSQLVYAHAEQHSQ